MKVYYYLKGNVHYWEVKIIMFVIKIRFEVFIIINIKKGVGTGLNISLTLAIDSDDSKILWKDMK